MNKKGISLISLIITIIVIIILAAIVMFAGLNTPDRANLAKFTSEFSDFGLAITNDYAKKYTDYSLAKESRTKAQIYYEIAKGSPVSMTETPTAAGSVNELGTMYPSQLTGTEYYLITSDTNVSGWKKNKSYYVSTEKHYVTNEGMAFVLPGYRVEEDGEVRWYVNEGHYYIGDEILGGEPSQIASASSSLISASYNRNTYLLNVDVTMPNLSSLTQAQKEQTFINWVKRSDENISTVNEAYLYAKGHYSGWSSVSSETEAVEKLVNEDLDYFGDYFRIYVECSDGTIEPLWRYNYLDLGENYIFVNTLSEDYLEKGIKKIKIVYLYDEVSLEINQSFDYLLNFMSYHESFDAFSAELYIINLKPEDSIDSVEIKIDGNIVDDSAIEISGNWLDFTDALPVGMTAYDSEIVIVINGNRIEWKGKVIYWLEK